MKKKIQINANASIRLFLFQKCTAISNINLNISSVDSIQLIHKGKKTVLILFCLSIRSFPFQTQEKSHRNRWMNTWQCLLLNDYLMNAVLVWSVCIDFITVYILKKKNRLIDE